MTQSMEIKSKSRTNNLASSSNEQHKKGGGGVKETVTISFKDLKNTSTNCSVGHTRILGHISQSQKGTCEIIREVSVHTLGLSDDIKEFLLIFLTVMIALFLKCLYRSSSS